MKTILELLGKTIEKFSACLDGLSHNLGEDNEFVKTFTECEKEFNIYHKQLNEKTEDEEIVSNTLDRILTPNEYISLVTNGEVSLMSDSGEALDNLIDDRYDGVVWSFPLSETSYIMKEHSDEMFALVRVVEILESGEEDYVHRWYELPDFESIEEVEHMLGKLEI